MGRSFAAVVGTLTVAGLPQTPTLGLERLRGRKFTLSACAGLTLPASLLRRGREHLMRRPRLRGLTARIDVLT